MPLLLIQRYRRGKRDRRSLNVAGFAFHWLPSAPPDTTTGFKNLLTVVGGTAAWVKAGYVTESTKAS